MELIENFDQPNSAEHTQNPNIFSKDTIEYWVAVGLLDRRIDLRELLIETGQYPFTEDQN